MTITVDEFAVADPADAWMRAGFNVDSDAVCRVGGVSIRLSGRRGGTGIVGWSLRGLPSDGLLHDLDGIPTIGTPRGLPPQNRPPTDRNLDDAQAGISGPGAPGTTEP